MSVLEGDEGNDKIALGICGEVLVLCGNILEESIVVKLDFVATLFEGDAKTLLRLNGGGLIAGVDLNHIICSLTFVLQDLDGFRGIVRSNHTVRNFTLQDLGGHSIASV